MTTRNMRTGGLLIGLAVLLTACQTPPGDVTPSATATEELSFADEMATSRVESLEMLEAARTATALAPTPTPHPTVPGQTPTVQPTPEIPPVVEIDLPSAFNGVVPLGAVRRLGQGTLSGVRPSPDGAYVAVGGSMGVTVYDTENFDQVWYGRTPAGIEQLEWSPDSRRIAAGLGDGSLIVWETLNGSRLFKINGAGSTSLDWSPDGTWLVTASLNAQASRWDATSGARLNTYNWSELYGPDEPLTGIGWSVAYLSPDGRLVATTYQIGGGDAFTYTSEVEIWDVITGQHLRTLSGKTSLDVFWSPDSRLLAAGSENGAVIWDAETGETLETLDAMAALGNPFYPEFYRLIWSPDGRWITVTSWYAGSVIFDTVDGEPLSTLNEEEQFIGWSAESSYYAVDNGAGVVIRDIETGQERTRIAGIDSVAGFSPDWGRLYGWTDAGGRTLAAWDMETSDLIDVFVTATEWVQSISWSPDGTRLVTGSAAWQGSEVVVWNTQTGEAVEALRPNVPEGWSGVSTIVTWSPDGRLIAMGPDGVSLWDVDARQSFGYLPAEIITGLAWSPDSTLLAIGDWDPSFAVRYVSGGEWLFFREAHESNSAGGFGIPSIDWSQEGTLIATGSPYDGTVLVWDADTGEQASSLVMEAEFGGINALAFSPDGTLIAAAGLEHYVEEGVINSRHALVIWDLQSGAELVRLREQLLTDLWVEYGITSVAWSPDGTMIAAAYGTPKAALFGLGWSPGGPSPVVVWDVASGERLHIFYGHTSDVQDVAFSPDGSLLASGSLDGTVILWDVSR